MRSLVTGGAGFIGSHLAQALLEAGDEVVVLDNLSTGDTRRLEGFPIDFIEGDIRDSEVVRRAMAGVQRVFHLAAMISVPESLQRPQECYAINLEGSLVILEAARTAEVERVVLSSSAAVYGGLEGEVSEDSPLHSLSPYAASKQAMEQAATLYADIYGLPTVSLRYFNVYGPGQSPDSAYAAAIPAFIQRLLSSKPPLVYGDGRQTRDFVFVKDVVAANLLAASTSLDGGNVCNIARGESMSLLQLLTILEELIPDGRPPEFMPERPGDVRHSAANIQKARASLGYRPNVDMRAGLVHTIQWFREGM